MSLLILSKRAEERREYGEPTRSGVDRYSTVRKENTSIPVRFPSSKLLHTKQTLCIGHLSGMKRIAAGVIDDDDDDQTVNGSRVVNGRG